MSTSPNNVTGANAGKRLGLAGKSRVVLRHWPAEDLNSYLYAKTHAA